MISQDNASSTLLIIFSFIMALVFLHSLRLYYKFDRASAIPFYANTLTSLGILGTFIGIALGILYFDTQSIDMSLVLMIEGLKTAFLTSILGLSLSIILKQWAYLIPNKTDRASEKTGDDELIVAIERQTQEITHCVTNYQSEVAQSLVSELRSVVENFNHRIAEDFGHGLHAVSEAIVALSGQSTTLSAKINTFHSQLDSLQKSLAVLEQTSQSSSQDIIATSRALEATSELLKESFDLIGQEKKTAEFFTLSSQALLESLQQVESGLGNVELKLNAFNASQDKSQSAYLAAFHSQFNTLEKSLLESLDFSNRAAAKDQHQLLNQFEKNIEVQSEFVSQLIDAKSMSQALNSELVRQVDQFSQSILSATRQNEAFVSEALSRLLDDMSSAFQTKFTLLNTATSESEKSIQHAISEIQAQHTELLRSHYLAYESFLEKEMAASSAQITDIMGYVSGEFTRDFQQLIEQMQTVNHELKSQVAENHEAN